MDLIKRSVMPIEMWLRSVAINVKQNGQLTNFNGIYHKRLNEAADRIAELEAQLARYEFVAYVAIIDDDKELSDVISKELPTCTELFALKD